MKAALAALTGLSQETRLSIFRLLVRQGPAGLAAGAIGEQLGIAPATLSFHLAHLERCGLLDARRDGRSIVYTAAFATMNALLTFLSENCCVEDACCPGAVLSASQREPRARRSRSHETSARSRRRD